MEYRVYEPVPHGQKGFYGKCAVYEREGEKALRSYRTIVMTEDAEGNLHRHWDGWSATTARHVHAAFGIGTQEYREMAVEALPRKWKQLQSTL